MLFLMLETKLGVRVAPTLCPEVPIHERILNRKKAHE